MAHQRKNLMLVSQGGVVGIGQQARLWLLATTDTAATIEAAGYFNESGFLLAVGDAIIASLARGGTPDLRLYTVTLVGPAGGVTVAPGGGTVGASNTLLNGPAAPVAGQGNNGDFYIETTNSRLYGPKAAGAWPGGFVSLVGVAGAPGTNANRNRLRNGNCAINQRVVAGSVVLAAGQYGHDGWKAGAAGCTYTFAAAGIDTVLTISAGSLIAPIEARMIEGGAYVASHAGSAQLRVWQGTGATGSGAYVNGPAAVTGLAANTQTNVEFLTGTVSLAQFEPGAAATAFERRTPAGELLLCQRYYSNSFAAGVAPSNNAAQHWWAVFAWNVAAAGTQTILFPAQMAATPTMTFYSVAGLKGAGAVTITIATPGVITWPAAHGFIANQPIVFTTTGALPTGLVAGTTYFVSATGLTATTFSVSATAGGATIATTGAQSGAHTGTPAAVDGQWAAYLPDKGFYIYAVVTSPNTLDRNHVNVGLNVVGSLNAFVQAYGAFIGQGHYAASAEI